MKFSVFFKNGLVFFFRNVIVCITFRWRPEWLVQFFVQAGLFDLFPKNINIYDSEYSKKIISVYETERKIIITTVKEKKTHRTVKLTHFTVYFILRTEQLVGITKTQTLNCINHHMNSMPHHKINTLKYIKNREPVLVLVSDAMQLVFPNICF